MTIKNISMEDFKRILSLSWSKETCYQPWQKNWSSENPERGQCYVTTKLFQKLFGGEIIKAKDSQNISHYWNKINDTEYDFTRNQYSEDEIFSNQQIVNDESLNEREVILERNFFKQVLRDRGFVSIYEWKDGPNNKYPEHFHKGRVSLHIVSGSVTFSGDFNKTLIAGDRFDVPVGAKHSAIVGPNGCEYIVGEEIEGDS